MSSGPGGGGKSLELMQRRLLSGQAPAPAPGADPPANQAGQQSVQQPTQQQPQQPQEQQPPAQQVNPAPRPGKTAASLMATQAREQAAAQAAHHKPEQQQQASTPAGRPKGKNFAAMAMSAGASSKPRSPIAPAPAQVAPPAPVMNSGAGDLGAVAPGRPKGKDFSAMANRMGAPPPQPVPVPHHPAPSQLLATQNIKLTPAEDEAQRQRARKMQAAARAAAGLPPLETLTATSVTTILPPITPPKGTRPGLNVQGQPAMQDVRHQQQLQKQQQMQQHHHQQQKYQQHQHQHQHQTLLRQQAASGARPRRQSDGASRTSITNPHYSQNRATPQPTEHEARLSAKSSKSNAKSSSAAERATAATKAGQASGAPHMAPLLGERIQDILNGIDPNYVMESEAEEQVLQLADDFLDKVIRQSLRLAQHRGSKALDVQDVQLVLAKQWGIVVPGLGLPNIRPLKPGKQAVSKTSHGGSSQASKRKSSDGTGSGGASRKKSTAAVSAAAQPTST